VVCPKAQIGLYLFAYRASDMTGTHDFYRFRSVLNAASSGCCPMPTLFPAGPAGFLADQLKSVNFT
jgi:hypothetical protein